ncbi:MAG: extensin family protein [Myxococcota bacterium]
MLPIIIASLLCQAPPAPPDTGVPVQPALPKDLVGKPMPWEPLLVDACKDKLAAAGLDGLDYRFSKVDYVATLPAPRGSGEDPLYCHVPQGTVLWIGPTGVHYVGFTHMSCALTLALARFEVIAQDVARTVFGRPADENPVRYISHVGTYNCRRQRLKNKVSQHSFGNAIDFQAFEVKGFGRINVLQHWSTTYKPWLKASEFLHTLARRLREEDVFTNVLDPDWDVWHQNHIHVDMAPTSHGEPSPALQRVMSMPTAARDERGQATVAEPATSTAPGPVRP